MEIYYFTIIVLSLFAFFEINNADNKDVQFVKNWMMSIAYIILVAQMGLRWETGTDWEPYLEMYKNLEQNFEWGKESYFNFEIGYVLFVQLIYKLFDSYSALLFIHAIVYYFFIFKSFNYFSRYFFPALLLFYSITLGMLGSSRSLMAVGIGMYSLVFLDKKKYIYFLLFLAIAFSFHTTSLLYGTYFFIRNKAKIWQIFILILTCLIIGMTSLPVKIFALSGGLNETALNKAIIYMQRAEEDLAAGSSYIGLIKRIVLASVFLYYRDKITSKLPAFNLMLNGYIFCIAFYFLFYKSVPIMIGRGIMYFNIMEPLLLASMLLIFLSRSAKTLVLVLMIGLSLLNIKLSISAYADLFDPYKGLFYNEEYHRIMH